MIFVILFGMAVLATVIHLLFRKKEHNQVEIFLSYLLFFNVGIMGLLGFYAHVFMAAETAQSIGWAPGSPFQFEIGIANLSFGILGILAIKFRQLFWLATIIGVSVFFIGDFVGHVIQYFNYGDTAAYNIGFPIWINDLILPLLYLCLLSVYMNKNNPLKNNS